MHGARAENPRAPICPIQGDRAGAREKYWQSPEIRTTNHPQPHRIGGRHHMNNTNRPHSVYVRWRDS